MCINMLSVFKMMLLICASILVAGIDTGMGVKYSVAVVILCQYITAMIIIVAEICAIYVISEIADNRWVWFIKTDRNSYNYAVELLFELITHCSFMLYVLSMYYACILYSISEPIQIYSSLLIIVGIGFAVQSHIFTKDVVRLDELAEKLDLSNKVGRKYE